jgi:voltage-gated potassium channel Kch
MKSRIIVCGLGRTGLKIFKLLEQQGADVVGISDRPVMGEKSDRIIIGDLRSPTTLIGAGIHNAMTLVLANNDDALNLAILTQARIINPRIRIINRLFNQTLGERLDRTLPEHFSMSVSALAAPIFAFAALGKKAIGQLHLFNETWPIHEEIIDRAHPWLGMELKELWDDPQRMLIYYLPSRGEIDLVSAVMSGIVLQSGDRLIVGNKPTILANKNPRLQKLIEAIVNLPQYQSYFRPVTLVSLALLATIWLATLIYVSVNSDISLVDALYFSVGAITGAGGKEEVAEQAPDSIKIFTAAMMIVGAAVIGICYALINDFILGTRLKQFWDAARVPSRHHYIVCGLGGIGIQILRLLHLQGYEVVAIESDPNNRFLHSARSLGIPVIIEDASLSTSLKAANVDKAEALIIVTSSDLTNLEIALTGKALAPKIPAIVRSYEPQFARSMQEVFEFERVLSPVELSTHSFVAAALGGRILGNGMTEDLLWVALATIITPNHSFFGKTVREMAIEADFVPLYLEVLERTIHSWELLETRLETGYVLYLTMPANRLERIWKHNDLMSSSASYRDSLGDENKHSIERTSSRSSALDGDSYARLA